MTRPDLFREMKGPTLPLLLTALWLGVNVIALAAWQIWGRG